MSRLEILVNQILLMHISIFASTEIHYHMTKKNFEEEQFQIP